MSATARKELRFAHDAFDAEARSYERGRPGYPDAAVAWMMAHLPPGATPTVLDLAAGTGKLTRLLAAAGADTVAVEPVAGMVGELVRAVPLALPLSGAAEALPLAAGSVDAVTVAQAFHWFQTDVVFPELHRVLRPGGGIGLIWNDADTSVDWVAKLSALSPRRPTEVLRRARRALGARSKPTSRPSSSWPARCRKAFAGTTLFGPIEHREFRHQEQMDGEAIVDWVRSFSRFSKLTSDEKADVLRQARQLTAHLPKPICFPYRTDVFWSRRLEL